MTALRTPNELAGVFKVRRWCIFWPLSVWVDEWQSSSLQKQERADWMFSDFLALAFMALVFIFALTCIMLERRNSNTSAAKTPKRRPKRRKRVTRSHYDDHHFNARRGPEEHSDDESYNPRGKVIRQGCQIHLMVTILLPFRITAISIN